MNAQATKQKEGTIAYIRCPTCDGHLGTYNLRTHNSELCRECEGFGEIPIRMNLRDRGNEWIYWAKFPKGTPECDIFKLFHTPYGARKDGMHRRPAQIIREGSRTLAKQRCRLIKE